jgi:F420-non-reducing hydrogenase iron-sulfur subunit
MNTNPEKAPKIIAFCCHWCAYAAADLAGSLRLSYPENITTVRVMCSGMVHPELVLECFRQGADGVLLLGCHDGNCRYVDGNRKAQARVEMIRDLLDDFGIDPDRFDCDLLSSMEADRFVDLVTAMHKKIQRIGPCSGPDL